MNTPGIEVRPIEDMSGKRRFNEIFLDNVRVPKENVIGELNRGWYAAMSTLDFERTSIDVSANARRLVDDLRGYASETTYDGGVLLDRDSVRGTLANMSVEAEVSRLLSYRVMWMQSRGMIPNHESSMAKAFGSGDASACGKCGNENTRPD